MRRLLALVPIGFAFLAYGHYVDDVRARAPIRDAVSKFTIDLRRPIETELIGYAPSADIAAQLLASAAIGDALGSKRLTNLSSVERNAWLDVPLYIDDELATAIDESLNAMTRNPGWPLHRYFVGKLAYTRDRRGMTEVEPDKWLLPLFSAYRNAPEHPQVVETFAGVLLEAWRVLPDEERLALPDVLGAAFVDPQFVRLAFDVAIDIIGRDATFDVLPETPSSLLEATRALGKRGDISGAATLYDRWERAEALSRANDLSEARTRLERGDWNGLLSATTTWASRHQIRDFDDADGRGEAAEVLKLWPRDQIGSWGSDRRGEFVRFFLDGRLASIDPVTLDGTVSSLANAPPPIRARVALAAGDLAKAESIVRNAGSEGGFEWTDYFVDLARLEISRNNVSGAVDAIGRISPAARRECDVVIVRRLAGESLASPDISVTDESGNILEEAWSTNGMLGVCVDPTTSGTKTLVIDVTTTGPALLEWGLNTGRRDTVFVETSERIELPLSGLTGRNVIYTKVLWGDRIEKRTARLE